MRGSPDPTLAMLSSLSTEDLIPPYLPIRRIRVAVDAVLAEMDDLFEGMYAVGVGAACHPKVVEVDGADGAVLDPFGRHIRRRPPTSLKKAKGTAWKSKPSWYIVANNDQTVNPDLERFAARAHAGRRRGSCPQFGLERAQFALVIRRYRSPPISEAG